jgi:hypothetical protein
MNDIPTAEVTVAQNTSIVNTTLDLGEILGWHSRFVWLLKLDCMIWFDGDESSGVALEL